MGERKQKPPRRRDAKGFGAGPRLHDRRSDRKPYSRPGAEAGNRGKGKAVVDPGLLGELHGFLDDPRRTLVAVADLMDGRPDTNEGQELWRMVSGLAGI